MDLGKERILGPQAGGSVIMGVIAGDPPLSEDVFAWGMQHINTRLFRALDGNIKIIVITNSYTGKIEASLQKKCLTVHYPFLIKLLRKLVRLFFSNARSEHIVFKKTLEVCAQVLHGYQFENYAYVEIVDETSSKSLKVTKENLEKFRKKKMTFDNVLSQSEG